jgi:hypothetical protein
MHKKQIYVTKEASRHQPYAVRFITEPSLSNISVATCDAIARGDDLSPEGKALIFRESRASFAPRAQLKK